MPEAVLAATYTPARNTVVLAASYPRPRAGADIVDVGVIYTPYGTLSGQQMLARLGAGKVAPRAGLPARRMWRAIAEARRVRWQRQLLGAAAERVRPVARGGALLRLGQERTRPAGAARDPAAASRDTMRTAGGIPAAESLVSRPDTRGAAHGLDLAARGREPERAGAVSARRGAAEHRPELAGGVWPALLWAPTKGQDKPARLLPLRGADRAPARPARMATDGPGAQKDTAHVAASVAVVRLIAKDVAHPAALAAVRRLDRDTGRPLRWVPWWPLTDKAVTRVAIADRRLPRLPYPVFDVLVMGWVPHLTRATVEWAAEVTRHPVAGARPHVAGAVLPPRVPPKARQETVHAAALLRNVGAGTRTPTMHGAGLLAPLRAGGLVPRRIDAVLIRGPSWAPVDRPLEAALLLPGPELVRVDPRQALLVARLHPLGQVGKPAWVITPAAVLVPEKGPKVSTPEPTGLPLVLPAPLDARLLGAVPLVLQAPHDALVVLAPEVLAVQDARLGALLEDARVGWGNYAPYLPWPPDNTRPYDPPQEPWPDTQPVDDPANPPPDPVADPVTGEPTHPAPGQDPATGDPAILPPQDPVQVPDERDEDFDVEVEEGILLNFIVRFWDIWTTYRVYYAHITALEAVNHLFGLLAAWLNDNAFDARYWAIYWTVRDCGRSAAMEFCPTYLRREWRNYHEDFQDLDRDPPPVGEWRDDPVRPWRIISGIDADGAFWAVLRSAPGLAAGEESWVELEVETYHDDAAVVFDRAVQGRDNGGLATEEVAVYAEDFEDGVADGFSSAGAGWSVLVTTTGNTLRSDNAQAGDVAVAELAVTLAHAGYVEWDYQVWANRLRAYVDGALVLDSGATPGWVAAYRVPVPAGTHLLRWEVEDLGEVSPEGHRFAELDDVRAVEYRPVAAPDVVDSALEFYVNGALAARWQGETPWNDPAAPPTFPLGRGRHVLRWRFVRGQANPGEDERALIDDIRVTHVALVRAWAETVCQPGAGGLAVQRVWECLMRLWHERHRLKRLRRRWLVT